MFQQPCRDAMRYRKVFAKARFQAQLQGSEHAAHQFDADFHAAVGLAVISG